MVFKTSVAVVLPAPAHNVKALKLIGFDNIMPIMLVMLDT